MIITPPIDEHPEYESDKIIDDQSMIVEEDGTERFLVCVIKDGIVTFIDNRPTNKSHQTISMADTEFMELCMAYETYLNNNKL